MENKLAELIDLAKHIPESYLEAAIESLKEIKDKADNDRPMPDCPHCGSDKVVKNGFAQGKQRYLCRCCAKTYVPTTNSVMYYSHNSDSVWKQVIRDTINGIPLDETADALMLSHQTTFSMRHKILLAISAPEPAEAGILSGVCEADETYILESYKGRKLPEDFHRGPRKHGAKAKKRGISNEYICICAATSREGGALAFSVNRATPGNDDIRAVFRGRVDSGALVICDGAKSYGALEKDGICSVMPMKIDSSDQGFCNINTTNGFHSFIKERYRAARGFATKYLNRYNALFEIAFGGSKFLVDEIYAKLCDMNNRFFSIAETKTRDLLEI